MDLPGKVGKTQKTRARQGGATLSAVAVITQPLVGKPATGSIGPLQLKRLPGGGQFDDVHCLSLASRSDRRVGCHLFDGT